MEFAKPAARNQLLGIEQQLVLANAIGQRLKVTR